MLRGARAAGISRIAAAIVAVTLSGAPRVLALQAPAEAHACQCRAHAGDHRECDCALCRKASLAAQARDEKQPSCHRAAARTALAQSRTAGSGGADACVEGTCGATDRAAMAIVGGEPFCLPTGPVPPRLPHSEEARPAFSPRPHDRPADPETPPPRPA